jgi:hypothetical protein
MAICESKPPKCFSLVDLNVVMKHLLPFGTLAADSSLRRLSSKFRLPVAFDLVDGIAIECGEN